MQIDERAAFDANKERWCKTMDRPVSACGCPDCGGSLIQLPSELRTNIPLAWADSEDDKPESRADLRRVLTEWNDVTGALPRDSGWMCEVLGMMEDAYDLGAHQAAKEPTE